VIDIFIEMTKPDFEKARSIFTGFDYQIVVRAVIEGSSHGKIWVDDIVHPNCGFMATTEGWFLAGDPDRFEFNRGLKDLFYDMILRGKYYSPVNPVFLRELFFHIDTEKWISKFSDIFDIRPPLPSRRIHFTCQRLAFDWKTKMPSDYRLLQVNTTLDTDSLEFPDDIREWVEHSLAAQKERGFGQCLVHGKKVVVWINADCASGNECEIGIITTKDYRRKGLGAITAAAAVESCFLSGYSLVGWHADDINEGSIAVAQKVGFVKERDYVHYICMFSEAEHLAESGLRHFHNKDYDCAISDFDKASQVGEVPVWSYVITARSYAAIGDANHAMEYLIKAKENGWSNWDRTIQDKALQSLFTVEKWNEIVAELK
jgi:RimJ/RimL family protein N-acetyltransferase